MTLGVGTGKRGDYVSFVPITTRWMDNDIYGHVNNVIYYSFFDTAANQLLIEAGILEPGTSNIIGLVVETQCRYVASLTFPDRVTARVRVAKIGNSSVRYEVGLFCNEMRVRRQRGILCTSMLTAITACRCRSVAVCAPSWRLFSFRPTQPMPNRMAPDGQRMERSMNMDTIPSSQLPLSMAR